ncbi:AP-3 complex subunit beta [Coemansia sp. RSA 1287]|nr:AP-3 complex subunit beta [Coemansia sp. RSA 1287]
MAEYLSRAMAFAQDAAKLSMRLSEGLVDNALEFGLDTPGSFYDNAEYKLGQVRTELNSGTEKEKLTAMKRLLACVAKGHDVSEYFADVVKNVATGSLEVRRLVYMYLLRYAEQEQDLALLSVNTFQRDVADTDAVIRAMALRVMSSIRVPAIGTIVVLAVRRLSTDASAHVRRTAAMAVPKLLRLDSALREELEEVVSGMLGEISPLAVGAVVRAFCAVSPQRLACVHTHFRRWCAQLGDADEWGQLELVRLLTAYARTQFAQPDSEGSSSSEQPGNVQLDPDHALLLGAVEPLLNSRNRAVVAGAAAAVCHLAPAAHLSVVARPLVRVMRSSREAAHVVLASILLVAQRRPSVFYPHVRSFFVAAADTPFVRRMKLNVLSELVAPETAPLMVREVAAYTQGSQEDVAVGAVSVLLRCAQHVQESTIDCLQSLLLLSSDVRAAVSAAAMRAVHILLVDGTVRDARPAQMTLYDMLCVVARTLDTCKGDVARAHVISVVGEFAESRFGCQHSLDVLRSSVRAFRDEGEQTRMQILELSTRLSLRVQGEGALADALREHTSFLSKVHAHVFTLARYDVSYEVRDRARSLRGLCPLPGYDDALVEAAPHVLAIASELLGSAESLAAARTRPEPEFTLGSLSLTVGRKMRGYEPLPDWPAQPPQNVDRGPAVVAVASGPQPIAVAGISGRTRADAGYATPRSTADDEDLDAFLDSAEDDATVLKAPFLPPAAVVFEQALESSSDEYSDSDSESEVSGSESVGSNSGSESSGLDSDESGEHDKADKTVEIEKINETKDSETLDADKDAEETSPFIGPPDFEGTSKYWQ